MGTGVGAGSGVGVGVGTAVAVGSGVEAGVGGTVGVGAAARIKLDFGVRIVKANMLRLSAWPCTAKAPTSTVVSRGIHCSVFSSYF